MELKDPITDATLTEEQLLATKLPETPISPSDDENSSIITVRSNDDSSIRLHLADAEHPTDTFLTATQHDGSLLMGDLTDANMQTIVEVVNPLISGDGHANQIAIGRSNDASYPSMDDPGAQGEFDSLDAYNTASELSLSDRMKNVLQELVENERVKLSFSQSISESDNDDDTDDEEEEEDEEDEDSDAKNTDDDMKNEPLRHDDDDDINQARTKQEENGNTAADARPDIGDNDDDDDDMKNANVFVYENPNFMMASDEMDAGTSQQIITSPRNEHDEKLKEKLLSELNVQPSIETIVSVNVIEKKAKSDNEEEEESSISVQDDIPTSPTELSSKSNSSISSGSGKRRKRKSKAKRK